MNLSQKRRWIYYLILVPVMLLLISWTSGTGYASSATTAYSYVLRVSTGAYSGKDVGIIMVKYTDTNGALRTLYYYADETKLQETLAKAAEKNTSNSDMGYVTKTLAKMGYEPADYSKSTLLASYSTSVFIIDFPYQIKSVNTIAFVTDIGMTKRSVTSDWNCIGFELYKLKELKGLVCQGTISNSYNVLFSGTMIAKNGPLENGDESFWLKIRDGRDSILSFTTNPSGIANEYKLEIPTTPKEYDSSADYTDLHVKIDIADIMYGGIEALTGARDGTNTCVFPELLTLAVSYTDTMGNPNRLEVPLIANALHQAYMHNLDEDGDLTDIHLAELMGQSGSVYLKLRFYNYAGLQKGDNVSLIYNPTGAAARNKLTEKSTAKTTHDTIISYVNASSTDDSDTLSVSGISIWEQNGGDDIFDVGIENGTVITAEPKDGADPDYNNAAPTYEGVTVKPNNIEVQFRCEEYTGGDLRPDNQSGKYILVLHTTDIPQAGTLDDIEVSLGYTLERTGMTRYTDTVSLSEMTDAYYGYWPGSGSLDVGYEMSVRSGGYLFGIISVDNVMKFKSLTVELKGEDTWQFDELHIYQVGAAAITGRKIIWVNGTGKYMTNGDIKTDRIVYRAFNSYVAEKEHASSTLTMKGETFQTAGNTDSVALVSLTDKIVYLDAKENKKTIDFESKETRQDVDDYDWRESDKYKEMSYEDTQRDMGFATKKVNYTIDVHVGKETYTAMNGDAGSANYFYFQLVFENGNSAFVQANQQLAADAFISGEEAVFNIATNYDYGEVKYVNIIPDDISSTADPYDKLKIDYIEVTKNAGESSVTWISTPEEGNEWVGIDYREEAEVTGGMVTESRAIEDIMRIYPVTSKKIKNRILVSINTGGYSGNTPQLEASALTAIFNVTYVDGSQGRISVDMIDQMYEFLHATPVKKNGVTVTDTSTMLKEGQWNYFVMDVADVVYFDSVEISVETKQEGRIYWSINGFKLERIVNEYGRQLNKVSGELELDCDKELITVKKGEEPILTNSVSGQAARTYMIELEEQDVPLQEATTEAFTQDRIPESINDYVNILVYMEDNGTNYSSIDPNCQITYSNMYETYYKTSPDLKRTTIDGQTVYYANGVGAKGMVSLSKVKLWVDNKNTTGKVKKVVVQHCRSGVLIQSFYLGPVDGSLKYTQNLSPSGGVYDDSIKAYQVVTLGLGSDTSSYTLTPETEDVAVAIKYTLKTGTSTAEYQSPFIFLTDEGYTSIGPNDVLKLRFEQSNLATITGLVVSVTGKDNYITLDSASIGMYEEAAGSLKNENLQSDTDKDMTCVKWYSVAAQKKIQASSTSFSVTGSKRGDYKAIVPMSITFETMKTQSGLSNPGLSENAGAEMIIFYLGIDGKQYYRKFDNIQKYCENYSTKSFSAGYTATISFMEQNIKSITAVVIRPYDDDDEHVATWGVANVSFSFGDGVDRTDFTIPVNKMAYENGEITDTELVVGNLLNGEELKGLMIGVKDVIITLKAQTENGHTGEIDTITYVNGEGKEIPTIRISKLNAVVNFSIKLENNDMGATVRAGQTTKVDACGYLSTKEDGTIDFAPPTKDLDEEVTYTIEVISKENPSSVSSFYVVVEKGLVQSGIRVTTKDVYQGETPEFTLTMNKKALSETQITCELEYVLNDGAKAGAHTEKEVISAKIEKDTDSITIKPTKNVTGNYGSINVQVLTVTGGGYDEDIDLAKAKATAKIKSVGAVYVTATGPSGANTALPGENVTVSVTAVTPTEKEMTVTILLNGQQRALTIPAAETKSDVITIENPDTGIYTASIVLTEGGFDQTSIATAEASCTVGTASIAIETLEVSKESYDLGEDIVLNFRFDRVLEKEAVIKITPKGRSAQFYTFAAGTQEGTITLKNLQYAEGTYAMTISEVTYYGTAIAQTDAKVNVTVKKAVQETESSEETTAEETTAESAAE